MKALASNLFHNGRIVVNQPKEGYRYAIDSILLANFIQPDPGDLMIDLGTGCAIIPIILASSHPRIKLIGIEIQESLFKIASENILKNKLENQVSLIKKDIKQLDDITLKTKCDHVISNPPYIKNDAGRVNPDNGKAIARHEIKINLKELLEVASNLLHQSGKLSIIYPSSRLADLIMEMRKVNIEPKLVRFVHPRKNNDAKLVLVRGSKHGRSGINILNPLYIYETADHYSDEVQKMFDNGNKGIKHPLK